MESKEFIDCYLRGTTGCIKQVGEFCERCPLINYMRPRPITEVESFRSRAIEELEGTKTEYLGYGQQAKDFNSGKK